MKYSKLFNFILCASIFLFIFSVNAIATVYLVSNDDSVDSGGHLDWDYDTKYYSECKFAENLWNAYKPGVIREDSVVVVQDIFVTDVNSVKYPWTGFRDKDNATMRQGKFSYNELHLDDKESYDAAAELY